MCIINSLKFCSRTKTDIAKKVKFSAFVPHRCRAYLYPVMSAPNTSQFGRRVTVIFMLSTALHIALYGFCELMTCPNQPNLFSLIAAIPTAFRVFSFFMCSRRLMPKHNLSILVSITLICISSFFVKGQPFS